MGTQKKHTIRTRRLPRFLKKKIHFSEEAAALRRKLRDKHLHTVCREAGCPNIAECFSKPTATFMILGDMCTRNCRFCGVNHGTPQPPDPDEPRHIGETVAELALKHAVITSVTRDDMEDGGAAHFAETVRCIREHSPETTTEVLIPDFQGSVSALRTVLASGVTILNHNVETVPSLYASVRPEADFRRSLDLIRNTREITPGKLTKSGIMVGLGEEKEELTYVFSELAGAGCDALTIGQYLAPSDANYPTQRYVEPEEYETIRQMALAQGIKWVYAGPFVRSSYNAEQLLDKIKESGIE